MQYSLKNQPEPEISKRKPQPDLLEKIKSGKVVEVTELSSSADVEVSRVPSPLPFQKKCSKENIDLDYVSTFTWLTDEAHNFLCFLFNVGLRRTNSQSAGVVGGFERQMDPSAYQVDATFEELWRKEARRQHGHFGGTL